MRLSRFFIDSELQSGQSLQLPPTLVNYIAHVLRLKLNDPVVLFNGQAQNNRLGEFSARITELSRRKVIVQLEQFIEKDIESPLEIHLLQGISRSERMDFTIQKSVELGVAEITPVFTQHSNSRKLNDKQLTKKQQHWQAVADSACEQSGRTRRVLVHSAITPREIANTRADIQLLLLPGAEQSLRELKPELAQASHPRISLFIGPEGGLSPNEIEEARGMGFQGVSLGPRILRTETAGVTALSIVQFLWGDLA